MGCLLLEMEALELSIMRDAGCFWCACGMGVSIPIVQWFPRGSPHLVLGSAFMLFLWRLFSDSIVYSVAVADLLLLSPPYFLWLFVFLLFLLFCNKDVNTLTFLVLVYVVLLLC